MQAEFFREQHIQTVDKDRSWETNYRIWTLCTKLENVLLLYSVLEKLGHPLLWDMGMREKFPENWSSNGQRVVGTTVKLHHALQLPVLLFMDSFFLIEERQKSRKTTLSSVWNRCLAVSTAVRILLLTLLLSRCVLLNGPSCFLPAGTSEPSLPRASLPPVSSFFSHLKKA